MAAGRPFHCGFASITRAPLSFALMAQAVFILGGLSARALASDLAAKALGLMMAKAGKVVVGVGCQHHRQNGYSWRAPVAGPSSSSSNRVGAVCVLVPFAIRLVGASCSGEGMQRWVPRETLVVTGH
jgi:hypothetical protein